jgi:hypothetical protein
LKKGDLRSGEEDPVTPCRGSSTSGNTGSPFKVYGNIANYDLRNSHRKNVNYSGRITVFFRIIASAKKAVGGKLVQPGLIRAPLKRGDLRSGEEDPVTPCRSSPTSTNTASPCKVYGNIANYDLRNSHRKNVNYSGRITVFFRIIASAKKTIEGKLVQPGILRALIQNGNSEDYGEEGVAPSFSFLALPVYHTRLVSANFLKPL